LTVRLPGEADVPDEPSVQALRAAPIVPQGSRTIPGEPQLVLRHLPPEALEGQAGEELLVSFLADETRPVPAAFLGLPFSVAYDGLITGFVAVVGVPFLSIRAVVGGVKWLIPGESEAQTRIRESAQQKGCRCVTTLHFGEGPTERHLCYEPYWN
jgi:hypothetical protein